MYKILICDDESRVCDLIISLIDWSLLNAECVGVAENGNKALLMIGDYKPQIVITDICMPGLDGISLIKQGLQYNPETKFLIISGYSDFEYAQEAIKLGVVDYILKPIDQKELMKCLEKIVSTLELQNSCEKEKHEELSKLRECALQKIIHNNIFESNDILTIAEYENKIFSRYQYTQILLLRIIDKNGDNAKDYKTFLVKRSLSQIQMILEKIYSNLFYCIKPEGIYVLINEKNIDTTGKIIKELFKTLVMANQMFSDVYFYMGASRVVNNNHNIMETIKEAREAAFQGLLYEQSACIDYSMLLTEYKDTNVAGNIASDITTICNLFKSLESLDNSMINQFFSDMRAKIQSYEKTGFKQMELLWHIYKNFEELLSKSEIKVPFSEDIYFEIINQKDVEGIIKCIEDAISSYINEYNSAIYNACNAEQANVISKITCYLETNYHEQITLEKVGSIFGFNSIYLSQLFKKEKGVNFKDYLYGLRMEKAKNLIQSSDLPVEDVSQAVGYNDFKYFSKVFKKEFGITPKEFYRIYHIKQ